MKMTRILVAVTLVAASGLAAEKKAPKQKGPAPAAKLTVPADATRIDATTYTHTDASGKKWIYRQTPFGWARREEGSEQPASAPANQVETRVIEDGDSLRFERPGPFGIYKWTKKKSDLTEDEQSLWKLSREKTAAK